MAAYQYFKGNEMTSGASKRLKLDISDISVDTEGIWLLPTK